MIQTEKQACDIEGKVTCESPNPHLYKFEGQIEYEGKFCPAD